MIVVRIREVAKKRGIKNAYQLQKETGFHPSMAANLWKSEWEKSDLRTLNTLCNVLKCTPNDLLEFIPDEGLEET